jgi:restriction system protein
MPALHYPPEPIYQEPLAPGGLFGAKKKHEDAIARAQAEHAHAYRVWEQQVTATRAAYASERSRREQAEEDRLRQLAAAETRYRDECQAREADAAARNRQISALINDLAFDVKAAIVKYVDIVLANSAYPEGFPVSHRFGFDLGTRELKLAVTVPPPSTVPVIKEYRYVRASDEITSTNLALKAQKDRYAGAVFQTAVRTLKEIFQADRNGKIHLIALTVGTDTLSPATGRPETVPFVIAAADRATFGQFDLANIVPQATLEHLGAAISRSPFDLKPADGSRGVRVRGQ